MITKKQFEYAKALIAAYREQCIDANPIKTGDIYKYKDELFRVEVLFNKDTGEIFYYLETPQNFIINNNKIIFRETPYSSSSILKEGEKVKQISGDELMRLKELNNFAFYDWDDIESKKKTERLKSEWKELLKKCCHDWKDISSFLSNPDAEAYRCKVCDYQISSY